MRKSVCLLMVIGLSVYSVSAQVIFDADFEGAALINDHVTSANMDAGTAVGSWTVIDDQESDIRSSGGNTALLADKGEYSFEANFSETAVLTNNGVTVSLDTYMRRTGDASSNEANLKPQQIIGVDSHGHELFDIRITAGISHENAMRVGFVDALGVEHYLGSSGDVIVYSVDTPNSAMFQTLELTLHETTMDISYDGVELTNGIACRNPGISHISGLRLAGVNTGTGAFYDDIYAAAVVTSTNQNWPREGFIPSTTSGDNLIHVTTADFDGVGVKDHIVVMSTDGKVIAYPRPEMILNAETDQRLWEFDGGPTMGYTLQAADAIPSSPGEEVLLPGTDGHLRILSANGQLLADWPVGSGALTFAAAGTNSNGATRILTGGVDGVLYALEPNGTSAGSFLVTGSMTSFLTHAVVGNFDGQGGDEIMLFFSLARLNQMVDCFDFDALDGSRPVFWEATCSLQNNLHELEYLRTFPFAYDMDGDGKDEVVGPWGILRPEEAWEGGGG
jgi:hypothetical protein